MRSWAVHAFPRFRDAARIQAARAAWDPLADLIPIHVTIVHPRVLDAAAAAALVDSVISAASRRGPFVVRLGEVLVLPPDHVALAVVVGGDVLAALRDELLPGVRTIDDDRPYVPHVTVGRVDPDDTFVVAARAAALLRGGDEALVDELLVESFAEDGASFIEARAAMLAAAP